MNLVLVLTLVVISVDEIHGACPLGFIFALTSCYRIHIYSGGELRTWTQARKDCWHMHSDLVVLNDPLEGTIVNVLARARGVRDDQFFWVGMSDVDREGVFRWVDGTPQNYTAWAPDEPTSDQNVALRHNYVMVSAKFGWVDARDNGSGSDILRSQGQPAAFICEHESRATMTLSGGKTLEKIMGKMAAYERSAALGDVTQQNHRDVPVLVGAPGQPGRSGPKGSEGPPGKRGSKGERGSPGLAGRPGEVDYKKIPRILGPMGSRGLPGNQGPSGPRGVPGEKGDAGAPGPIGRTGPGGEAGSPGKPGPAGAQGPAGQQAPRGLIGPAGPAGPPGDPGVRASPRAGLPGSRGEKGGPGAKGEPGSHGIQGRPGSNGSRGVPGAPGLAGNPGKPGKTGRVGEPGVAGRPGKPGLTGAAGRQGGKGEGGQPGLPGTPGAAGPRGEKGAMGLPGPPGPIPEAWLRVHASRAWSGTGPRVAALHGGKDLAGNVDDGDAYADDFMALETRVSHIRDTQTLFSAALAVLFLGLTLEAAIICRLYMATRATCWSRYRQSQWQPNSHMRII